MNPSRPLQFSVLFFATLILFISLAWFYTWANKLEVSQDITLRTFQLNLEGNSHCMSHSSHRMMGTLLAGVDFIDGWESHQGSVECRCQCLRQVIITQWSAETPRHQEAWDWALRLTWHWADTGWRLEPGGWALHSGMQCWRPGPSHPARQPGTMQQN